METLNLLLITYYLLLITSPSPANRLIQQTLISGADSDTLTGGGDSDTFVLAEGEGTDTITDFTSGEDLIGLSGGITFNDLSFSNSDIISGNESLATLTGVDSY